MIKGATFVVRGENRATSAMRGVVTDMGRVEQAATRVSRANREMARTNVSVMRGMSANRRIVQQFGFQVTDFTTQIAGGQSALLAFVQQGGQLLQFFGATGAVLATLLTVFGTAALIFLRSGQSLATLTPIMGVLYDDFVAIGNVLRSVGEFFIDFANLVVNNLDTVLVSAIFVASFFLTRWVTAMVVARAAAMGLTLDTARLAGAQVILAAANSGFAIASMTLAAAHRIAAIATATVSAATAIYAVSTSRLAAALVFARVQTMLKTVAVQGLTAAVGLTVTAFRALRLAILATGIGALVIGVGALITGLMRARDALGSWGAVWNLLKEAAVEVLDRIRMSFGMIPIAVRMGSANMARWFLERVRDMWEGFESLTSGVAGAFDGLFGTDLTGRIAGVGSAIAGVTDGMAESARLAGQQMAALAGQVLAPIDALRRLREAMTDDTTVDIRDWFTGGGTDDPVGGAQETADRIRDIYTNTARTISSEFKSAFRGLIDGSKSATDVIQDMLVSILNRIYDIMMTPVFDNIARTLAGGLMNTLGPIIPPAPVATFAGGGRTPRGVRAGGVDGMGGRLAVVHPSEKIIDETTGRGGGGGTQVIRLQPVINNYSNENVQQETQAGPNGEMMLITTIGRAIVDGKLDGALGSRLKTGVRTTTR